jgi:hypothetical protein
VDVIVDSPVPEIELSEPLVAEAPPPPMVMVYKTLAVIGIAASAPPPPPVVSPTVPFL